CLPGGTVDAYDTWLELKGTDDKGQTIFWSGMVEDNGKGPVEKGAHFYRSLQVDAHGNRINKRNAWATRSVVYVHLIPPGAADTAHYRLHIPENAGDQITLHARLNYRKFSWFNTHFSFAGVEADKTGPGDLGRATTPDYDDRQWAFKGDTAKVSGNLKTIPNLPITTIAEDTKTLRVLPRNALEKSLVIDARLARTNFFYARALKEDGDYDGAIAHLRTVLEQYPRDRVVRNELGRVLFLQKRYADADREFEQTLSIDPEDLQAHYNLMLCYNGLGDDAKANEHKTRYLR